LAIASSALNEIDQSTSRTNFDQNIISIRRTDVHQIRDRCYDFKNIFAQKVANKLAFLTQNKAKLCKILIITLVFEKNANFFRRKLAKFAENCDHNIDPR
jgi:hypothetical protein